MKKRQRTQKETPLTEKRNPKSMRIDQMSVLKAIDLMNSEDASVIKAVQKERKNIAAAVDLVVRSFRERGRLFYVGAGTSGRLGVLDSSECPPTFGTNPAMVQGIIAGGAKALRRSIEGAEDKKRDGREAIRKRKVHSKDTVIGIAASATTPFVHAALAEAKARGASTVFLCCNPKSNLNVSADVFITPLVGPEIVTGSTRLKAGTATKLVLNMITTISMIRIGKVYENLMVDLQVKSRKLQDRAERIIIEMCRIDRPAARKVLKKAGGNAKIAIVMAHRGVSKSNAETILHNASGFLRKALL